MRVEVPKAEEAVSIAIKTLTGSRDYQDSDCRLVSELLLFEQIQECLTVVVLCLRCGTAALLFDQGFGLEKGAQIVGALVCDPDLDRFYALVAC